MQSRKLPVIQVIQTYYSRLYIASNDFRMNADRVSRMKANVRSKNKVWGERYIGRKRKNNPPFVYALGETVLIRFPFSIKSKAAPKRRSVIKGKSYKAQFEAISIQDFFCITQNEGKLCQLGLCGRHYQHDSRRRKRKRKKQSQRLQEQRSQNHI